MANDTDFGPGYGATLIYWIAGGLTTAGAFLPRQLHYDWKTGFIVTACLLALAGLLGWCAQPLSRQHKAGEQRKRDVRAAEILSAGRKGRSPDFSLYLRSFETTGRMPFSISTPPGFDLNMGADAVADFELSLAQATEYGAPLIALGRPGEQMGAGRILTTDEHWQDDLSLLARKSIVIFMAPSIRPGTMWEIEWLTNARLLNKTIWIQPPAGRWSLGDPFGKDRFDWRAAWNPITVKMLSNGLEAPLFDKNGTLFTFDNERKLEVTSLLKGHSSGRALGMLLRRHLEKMALRERVTRSET